MADGSSHRLATVKYLWFLFLFFVLFCFNFVLWNLQIWRPDLKSRMSPKSGKIHKCYCYQKQIAHDWPFEQPRAFIFNLLLLKLRHKSYRKKKIWPELIINGIYVTYFTKHAHIWHYELPMVFIFGLNCLKHMLQIQNRGRVVVWCGQNVNAKIMSTLLAEEPIVYLVHSLGVFALIWFFWNVRI